MSRQTTSYYGASLSTQFAWATTDNDIFDRELDLYRLAQAVENHDHSSTRGLAVARLAAGSITEAMYGSLSVSTRALADLSVTTGKIPDGAITDAKMANQKVNRAGDTMTNNLNIQISGTPTAGYVFYGNGGAYMGYDGFNMIFNHPTVGGSILMLGNLALRKSLSSLEGYLSLGNTGALIGYDGTNYVVAGGSIIQTTANSVPAPLGGMVAFRTLAELTAAGARWARETTANGRLLIGAGQAGAIPENFAENTNYGTTWAPLTYMGYSLTTGTLAVSGFSSNSSASFALAAPGGGGGSFNASTEPHTHAINAGSVSGAPGQNNSGASFLPPMLGVIWGRRIS